MAGSDTTPNNTPKTITLVLHETFPISEPSPPTLPVETVGAGKDAAGGGRGAQHRLRAGREKKRAQKSAANRTRGGLLILLKVKDEGVALGIGGDSSGGAPEVKYGGGDLLLHIAKGSTRRGKGQGRRESRRSRNLVVDRFMVNFGLRGGDLLLHFAEGSSRRGNCSVGWGAEEK
ncbi:unnamed protein product [Calypogeia fissa]